jgi:hypothetical protein
MNRDEIIKLIEGNGLTLHGDIEHFAALVEAAEREACAKVAETPIGEYEVVVACGTEPTPHRIPQYANWQDIATAIRARGHS